MIDSLTLEVVDHVPGGTLFARVDRRTGAKSWKLPLPDSDLVAAASMPDEGWAWIPRDSKTINVQPRGQSKPQPHTADSWFSSLYQVSASRDGRWLAFAGWSAPSEDSVGYGTISLADGKITRIGAMAGEGGSAIWMDDGSLMLVNRDTPESNSIFTTRPGEAIKKLGTIPRQLFAYSIARNMKRMAAITRDYKGDAWVSRVVKR